MTVLSRVQDKLTNKVFTKLGSSLVLEAYSSSVVDKWGDPTPTYASSTLVVAVPFNLVDYRESFMSFGDLQEGETDLVVPYNTSIDKRDRITFLGSQYFVKERENYVISDDIAAYVVRLAKVI